MNNIGKLVSIRKFVFRKQYMTLYTIPSQCSTLVRNTVVSATFKVNGKPPILGSRSPLTPWPFDLIFDMGDYVGDMTSHTKNGKNRPRRAGPAKGWNVKVKCSYFLFL